MAWIDQTAVADTQAPLEALRQIIAGTPDADGEPTTERLAIEFGGVNEAYDGPKAVVEGDPEPSLIEYYVALRYDADLATVPTVEGVTVRGRLERDLKHFGGDLPPPPPDPIIAFRANASMDRADFVNAAADIGLLTDDEAIAAAKGDWPSSFDVALPGDAGDARRAKVLWASTATIQRNAPLIAAIIASPIPITEAQVDALFGYDAP
jgi:hypothetical protein